jgi:ribose transport system substrate-binding protein
MIRRSIVSVATLAGITALLAACTAQSSSSPSSSPSSSTSSASTTAALRVSFNPETKKLIPYSPVSSWCGKKHTGIKMAVSDGVSFNTWRQLAFATIKQQALECPAINPNIQEVSGNGNQQTTISDINSLVAEGVKLIILNGDFGQAELPAITAATKKGVTVVPYVSAVGGTPGVNYAASTIENGPAIGEELMQKVAQYLKGKGTVIFLGGNAGAPSSQAQFDGAMQALKSYPGMKMLVSAPVATDWAEPEAQQAVAGLIAKYPQISAVYTDYGPTAQGAADAFIAAGKKIPVIATVATGNQLGCFWHKESSTANSFVFFSADATLAMPMAGTQQGIAAATGGKYTANQSFVLPIVYDTPAGKDPVCNASLPTAADFTGPLSVAQMVKVLK